MKKYLSYINERFEDLSIATIAAEFGLNPLRITTLGGGCYGQAYRIVTEDDDKVIKLTKDKAEYMNALKLKSKPVTKYLINYYDARQIKDYDEISNGPCYILLMDYVKPLKEDEKELDIYWQIEGIYDANFQPNNQVKLFDDSKIKEVIDELEQNSRKIKNIIDVYSKEIIVDRLCQINNIFKEGEKYNIPIKDTHHNNIGLKDGHYVYFDIGCKHSGDFNKIKHLKKWDFEKIKKY